MVDRRLAAIMAIDVVGFSRLAGADEEGTLAALKAHRHELIDPTLLDARGRIVKTMGDGLLVEFPSCVDAVRCAVEVQRAMADRNAGEPADRRMDLRIGVHVGDVVVDGTDLLGDGVNIAARLESIAPAGGLAISEDVWRQIQGKVQITFADRGEQTLKNIARPIRVFQVEFHRAPATDASGRANPSDAAAIAAPELPSLAVLPFQNMSGDADQDFFADGLVEDIITTLSKLAGLRVVARNSSFVYKGKPVDVREAGKQLGVRYVLEGSVRRSGNRIRITAQLIDAANGSHLWAERYDRSLDDMFAVQDEITLVLATEMQVKLTEGEQARLHYTTTSNVEAWSLWVQGLARFRDSVSKDNCAAALALWERALSLDPDSAPLNAMVGFMHVADARFGWWDERATALEKAAEYNAIALTLDPQNPDAHTSASMASLVREEFDDAVTHARKAVALAPSSADAAVLGCFVLCSAGLADEAVPLIEKAMRLSPHYPSSYLGNLGNAYRLTGRIEDAIAAFKESHARSPGFGLTDLVIACQESGRVEDAAQAAQELVKLRRGFTIASWLKTQFRRDKAQLAAEAAALKAAGLPEA